MKLTVEKLGKGRVQIDIEGDDGLVACPTFRTDQVISAVSERQEQIRETDLDDAPVILADHCRAIRHGSSNRDNLIKLGCIHLSVTPTVYNKFIEDVTQLAA